MASLRLARRELPRKRHDCVAALDKGMTIACALRLVLTLSGGSESASEGDAVHLSATVMSASTASLS
ncbi:hypothetical protein E2H98_15900 [Permianibacter aggregans]|nr:hypothetical protein E2H98_15900 [Permianibacter aggregans]